MILITGMFGQERKNEILTGVKLLMDGKKILLRINLITL